MFKKRYASRSLRGKLRVSKYLYAEKKLKKHIPKTVSFSRDHLEMMLKRFDMLYVKPDFGFQGRGISKLKRAGSGYELYEIEGKRQIHKTYASVSNVYRRLKKQSAGKLIIQKGIALDRVKDRPYDIRAMVQRKPKGSWVCTGFMVKVGGRNKIVTNYYQGGAIYTLKMLGAEQGISSKKTAGRVRKLTDTALQISNVLSKHRSGMHELGIDFAYDKKGHLWVLEVNSSHPQFHPLKRLDPPAYKKMKRFAASYGRREAT